MGINVKTSQESYDFNKARFRQEKLKKKFPKTEIITMSAMSTAHVSPHKIISMEPLETSVSEVLTRAWKTGVRAFRTELTYK